MLYFWQVETNACILHSHLQHGTTTHVSMCQHEYEWYRLRVFYFACALFCMYIYIYIYVSSIF